AGILIGNNSTLGGTLGGLYGGGIQNLAGSTIAGGQYGIAIQSGGVVTSGITNAGSIVGATAIYVGTGSQINNGITNTGLISGTVGISNAGTIAGVTAIQVAAGGTVQGNITNTGLISGSNAGIAISSATLLGGINNQSTGTITGGQYGVLLNQAATLLTQDIANSGLIAGSVAGIAITSGVNLYRSISNSVSGTITGGAYGISSAHYLDSIANAGLITGSVAGIVAQGSGVIGAITNSIFGTIAGGSYGVLDADAGIVGSTSVAIMNAGTIMGSIAGIAAQSSNPMRSITNSSSGTIVGGNYGILVGTSAGGDINDGVFNSGLILGSSIAGIGLDNGSYNYADINNSATGTIAGGQFGISVANNSNAYQDINNQGLITGSVAGILVDHSNLNGIINQSTGTIAGGAYGISISNTGQINGSTGISNAGTIYGATAIKVATGSQITSGITNSGLIYGSGMMNAAGIAVGSAASIVGGIVNSGSILGNSVGVVAYGGASIRGGITNTGLIGAANFAGVLAINNGYIDSINNQSLSGSQVGTIAGYQYGIAVQSGGTIGSINNAGTIISLGAPGPSNPAGIYLGGSGPFGFGGTIANGITNTGSILSPSAGILITSNSQLSGGITNAGLINGQGWAGVVVNDGATATGGISNAGTILAASYGLDIFNGGTVLGGVTNTGTISTGDSGPYSRIGAIFLAGGGLIANGITNTGLIQGANGIYVGQTNPRYPAGGTILGGIANLGQIVGESAGIAVVSHSTATGGITNSGFIAGTFNGILVANNSYIDSINNQSLSGSQVGTIAGGQYGIAIQSGGTIGSINNVGTIISLNSSGPGPGPSGSAAINLGPLSGPSGSGGLITNGITNAGSIIGSGYGISMYRTSSVLGGLNNSGLIYGVQTAINIEAASTIFGGLANSGTISAQYGSGIYINNGAAVLGGVTNSGLIQGGSHYGGIGIAHGSYIDSIIQTSSSGVIGVISGQEFGIAVASGATLGSIINAGIISGGNNGIQVGFLSGPDTVAAMISGGITNTGLISGTSASGIFVNNNSYIDSINNQSLSGSQVGTIAGYQYGIAVQSGGTIGSINNAGLISGGRSGVYVSTNSTILGTINNTGTIAGNTYSLNLQNTASGLVVNNSGTLIGA
ncbi:beta strand repeat-containing protein, partial [Polynucleobacter asymbioticus]